MNKPDASANLIQIIRRSRTIQITYISLFTSLLALFILIISLIDLEPSTPKRNFQKLVNFLYQEVTLLKKHQQLDWLVVENTFSKGVKLTLSGDAFILTDLFSAGRAKINPYYVSYFEGLGRFIREIELERFPLRHQRLIQEIEATGHRFMITIRVEGYTDASPLAQTALYQNNIQLSTFRAYAVMHLLKITTQLPEHYFSIAGYGALRPLVQPPESAKNRRIEIYLIPQILEPDAFVL